MACAAFKTGFSIMSTEFTYYLSMSQCQYVHIRRLDLNDHFINTRMSTFMHSFNVHYLSSQMLILEFDGQDIRSSLSVKPHFPLVTTFTIPRGG